MIQDYRNRESIPACSMQACFMRASLLGVLLLWATEPILAAHAATKCAPKPILAVDFHGVLSRLSFVDLVKAFPYGLVTSIQNSITLIRTKGISAIQSIHLKEAFRNLNTQQPEQDVFCALSAAKQAGYTIVLFSNITPAEFDQYAAAYPELLTTTFDLQIRTGPLMVSADGRWLTKQDKEFYLNAERAIKKAFPEHGTITLLDDSSANIARAKEYVGWNTIHIDGSRNTGDIIRKLIATNS